MVSVLLDESPEAFMVFWFLRPYGSKILSENYQTCWTAQRSYLELRP